MFVASFEQVTSDKFKADSNENMPFIGNLKGGTAYSTLINGTVFEAEELIPNANYLCTNEEVEYTNKETGETGIVTNVVILDKEPISSRIELMQVLKEVGPPKLVRKKKPNNGSNDVAEI